MFNAALFHREPFAEIVSPLLRRAWSDAGGATVDSTPWDLATVAVRHGGQGVTCPVDVFPIAAVSSLMSADCYLSSTV